MCAVQFQKSVSLFADGPAMAPPSRFSIWIDVNSITQVQVESCEELIRKKSHPKLIFHGDSNIWWAAARYWTLCVTAWQP